jgi:hypothetical protein
MRRSRSCPTCAGIWEDASARFCGRCGAPLDPAAVEARSIRRTVRGSPGAGERATGRTVAGWPTRWVVTAVGVVAGLSILVAGIPVPIETADGSTADVELPDRNAVGSAVGDPGTAGRADDDVPTDVRSDGGRRRGLHCEPQGCEQWRVRLAADLQDFAVTSRWIAVVDGPWLRVRGTNRTDPGGGGWAIDLRELETPDGDTAVTMDPDGQVTVAELEIADDGTIVLGQRDRVLAVGPGGELAWQAGVTQVRSLELHGDRVVVFSAPEGRPDSSLERATSRSLEDGTVGWSSHTGRPLVGAASDLLTLGPNDLLERLDPETGEARWGIDLEGPRWVRAEGPWVVANRGRSDEALILDSATGEVLQVYDGLVPLGGIQRREGIAVGTWLQRGDDAPATAQVVVTAWDDTGNELWRRRIPVSLDDPCCVFALPWIDGTVAIGRPATRTPNPDPNPDRGWTFVDERTGEPRYLRRFDHPPLALRAAEPSDPFPPRVGRVFTATDGDTLWLTSGSGTTAVRGAAGASLVSAEPPVLVRPGELIGLRLIPAG